MRRAATIAIGIGIVAILASSCGEATMPPRLATTLEDRVVTIRELAEEGRPGLAIAATRNLMTLVAERLDAGRIDDTKAVEILEAAQLVIAQLELQPRPSAESPTPSEEDAGDPDKPDKGKGKGHDEEGNGNQGHGNDD